MHGSARERSQQLMQALATAMAVLAPTPALVSMMAMASAPLAAVALAMPATRRAWQAAMAVAKPQAMPHPMTMTPAVGR